MRNNKNTITLSGEKIDKQKAHCIVIAEKGKKNYCLIYWMFDFQLLKIGQFRQNMYIGFYDNGDENSKRLKEGITHRKIDTYEKKLIKNIFSLMSFSDERPALHAFECKINDEYVNHIKASDIPNWKTNNDYYLLEGIRREYGLPLFSMMRDENIIMNSNSKRNGSPLCLDEWEEVYLNSYKDLEDFEDYSKKVYPYLDELVKNWVNDNIQPIDIDNFFSKEFSGFDNVFLDCSIRGFSWGSTLYKKDDFILSKTENYLLSKPDRENKIVLFTNIKGKSLLDIDWTKPDSFIDFYTEDIYSLFDELSNYSEDKANKLKHYIPRHLLYENIETYLSDTYTLISCITYEGDLYKHFFPNGEDEMIELPYDAIKRYREIGCYFNISKDILEKFKIRYAKHVLMRPSVKSDGLKYLIEFDTELNVTKLDCFYGVERDESK